MNYVDEMLGRMANLALLELEQAKPVRNTTILKQITEESYNVGSNKDMRTDYREMGGDSMPSTRSGQGRI